MRVPRVARLTACLVLVGIGLIGALNVASPYVIEHVSMEPSIQPGDIVLVEATGPLLSTPGRGDVVLFRPPVGDPGTPFIKRVIGLPGDTIEIQDGAVFVDGRRLVEPSAEGSTDTQTGAPASWTVPAGSVFVLGDNREHSWDSRGYGPIRISAIVGRAWLAYGLRTSVSFLAASLPRWLPLAGGGLAPQLGS